jgi:hypothetical protein
MVLAGIAVMELQILPRVGYARVDPSRPAQWACVQPTAVPVAP